jgi:hypothetical protein
VPGRREEKQALDEYSSVFWSELPVKKGIHRRHAAQKPNALPAFLISLSFCTKAQDRSYGRSMVVTDRGKLDRETVPIAPGRSVRVHQQFLVQ